MFDHPHNKRPRATTKTMNFLFDTMSREEYRLLAEKAVAQKMTAKEYVGMLAAQDGKWEWVEPEDRPPAREGNC